MGPRAREACFAQIQTLCIRGFLGILNAITNFVFHLYLDLMSSLDLLLPIYYSARLFFDLRTNVACSRLDKDPLGYLTCWLKKLHTRGFMNVAILSFLSVREIKYTKNISVQREDWNLPEIVKGAYFSYHLFLGWSSGARSPCYSWVELGRQVTLKPPLPASWKRDVSYQLERSSEEVAETNANSMPSHSLPPLITLSSLLGHYPLHIYLLLNKL